jgi:rhodanese-related sulfurtransferase
MTQEQLAETLFDSLRNKIMPLADDVTVYPGHGAGSACGKNMMKETVDSLGNQKKMNYALRTDMTKEEFVKEVTDGLLPPPQYFPLNVKMNKEGYDDFDEVLERGSRPLSPEAFEDIANQTGAILLDVRNEKDFVKGHVPRSIFIGLDGSFAPWVGALVADTEQPILLVTPEGREEEAITRLARVGFDNTLGYLEGGFEQWKKSGKEYDNVSTVTAEELKKEMASSEVEIFDVRKESEHYAHRVPDSHNTPLDFLNSYLGEFPEDGSFYIHCAGGYRSVIAASILKSRGIHNMINVDGGFKAMEATKIKLTDYVCPSTMQSA